MIKVPTCFQNQNNPSSIDIILTNKKHSFMHSKSVTTGLSDYHSLICTMSRNHISRIKPIKITYRDFKKFNEHNFLNDLGNALREINFEESEDGFSCFAEIFDDTTNIHAPLKNKYLRGNNAPFVTKELRKEIRHRSRLRNKARKENTPIARLAYTKQRNKCTRMKRENIQSYFNDVAHDPVKKRFWETVNPFLSENGSHGQEDFLLEENGELVKDQKQIADIFCDYYTNIVNHATGNPPVQIPFRQNSDVIEDILSHYENHESIINIRNSMHNQTFEMPLSTEPKIREKITNIAPSKATGIDNVPPRLVKASVDTIAKPLTSIINKSIETSNFPNKLKIAKIAPIYKKNPKKEVD